MTYNDFCIFQEKSEANAKQKEKKMLYTPIECGFLVAVSFVVFVVCWFLVESGECGVSVAFSSLCNTISADIFKWSLNSGLA